MGPGFAPMRDPEWVRSWLAAKERAGCSTPTIVHYRWAARRADQHLQDLGMKREPSRWTVREARAVRRLFGEVAGSVAVLANLARFHGNRVFERAGVPPRGPPKRVRWLTDRETTVLLEVVRKDRFLRLICLLGLAHGLRRGDWVHLKVEDVDLDGRRLRLRTYPTFRSPERWVPMHPAVPDAVRDYLWARRRQVRRYLRLYPEGRVPAELFLHRAGGGLVPYRPHAADKWFVILERRMAVRGVSVRLSSEMLRRQGAVLLARRILQEHPEAPEIAAQAARAFLRQKGWRPTGHFLALRALHHALPPPGDGPEEATRPGGRAAVPESPPVAVPPPPGLHDGDHGPRGIEGGP